ncbi:hypothetical protein GCM10025881_14610 [Pseudolysinimonas kribbensis]|uniref:Phosphate acetyltransferase n=1 Tax=Pseudolysinimonas kribbensis TaxID=433641 RepID=A0ABQ6K770_9MICO|nr:hypothetical protein GCM10025881_14610 [Pseudolysinimonas kribbensis]
MATRVMVTSAEGGSGKSTIAAGLLEALTGTVGSVGVFRPIGRGGVDYVLDMLRSHAGASEGDGVGVDYAAVHADRDAALARILERCAEAERGHDAVLIVGSDYTDVGTPTEFAMNARVAATLAASVVLVLNARNPDGSPRTADQIAEIGLTAMAELRAEHAHLVALVVNRVDPGELDAVTRAVRERCGMPAWGVPDDAALTAPLLGSVLAATDAELVRGQQELLDRPVSGTVIAAMTLENVLPRLQEGAVVIVPGDRVDVLIGSVIAHASATFPTVAGVILNGGFELSEPVMRLLDGMGTSLPIARTRLGTFDTAIRATRAHSRLAADSPARHARAVGLVERHVDLPELIRLLRIEVDPTMTPLRFEQTLVERARAHRRRIVLPEADDDRILRAAAIVLQRGIADITLLGDEVRVRSRAAELGLDIDAASVVSPRDPELVARFAAEYRSRRAHKGSPWSGRRSS